MKAAILAALICLAATSALAVDFTAVLVNEDGKPYEQCVRGEPPKDGQPAVCKEVNAITLGQFVFDSLNLPLEPGAKPVEIVQRGMLAERIKTATAAELSDVERDMIKAALLRNPGNFPVAVVQALKIIAPAALKER